MYVTSVGGKLSSYLSPMHICIFGPLNCVIAEAETVSDCPLVGIGGSGQQDSIDVESLTKVQLKFIYITQLVVYKN